MGQSTTNGSHYLNTLSYQTGLQPLVSQAPLTPTYFTSPQAQGYISSLNSHRPYDYKMYHQPIMGQNSMQNGNSNNLNFNSQLARELTYSEAQQTTGTRPNLIIDEQNQTIVPPSDTAAAALVQEIKETEKRASQASKTSTQDCSTVYSGPEIPNLGSNSKTSMGSSIKEPRETNQIISLSAGNNQSQASLSNGPSGPAGLTSHHLPYSSIISHTRSTTGHYDHERGPSNATILIHTDDDEISTTYGGHSNSLSLAPMPGNQLGQMGGMPGAGTHSHTNSKSHFKTHSRTISPISHVPTHSSFSLLHPAYSYSVPNHKTFSHDMHDFMVALNSVDIDEHYENVCRKLGSIGLGPLCSDDENVINVSNELNSSSISKSTSTTRNSADSHERSQVLSTRNCIGSSKINQIYNYNSQFLPNDAFRVKLKPTVDNPDGYFNATYIPKMNLLKTINTETFEKIQTHIMKGDDKSEQQQITTFLSRRVIAQVGPNGSFSLKALNAFWDMVLQTDSQLLVSCAGYGYPDSYLEESETDAEGRHQNYKKTKNDSDPSPFLASLRAGIVNSSSTTSPKKESTTTTNKAISNPKTPKKRKSSKSKNSKKKSPKSRNKTISKETESDSINSEATTKISVRPVAAAATVEIETEQETDQR